MIETLICDVCNENQAVGVYASWTGPVSFAYCAECLKTKREPYGALVAGLIGIYPSSIEDIATWLHPYIHGTLVAVDKTVEQFFADVCEATDEYEKSFGYE